MFYIKAAIVIVFALLIALILAMMASFNPEKELNRALDLYNKGDIPASEEALSRLQSSLAPMQYHLYMAYLARASSDIEQSNKELGIAEKDAIDHANFAILLEIILNEAYNAYLTHNKKALSEAVKKAIKFGGPNQDWVLLFRGLLEYQNGEYGKALSAWKLDASRVPLSAWMQKSFESTFTPLWFDVRIARSNIEEGKISVARQLLEEQIPHLTGDDLSPVLFLMGYSYAKEAADKDPLKAVAYYKLAASYFKKTPFLSELYSEEREILIAQVSLQVDQMLQGSDYKDLPYYLVLLDSWQARQELDKAKELLLNHFNRSITVDSSIAAEEIYAILRVLIPEGAERQGLEKSLQEVVNKKNLENLDHYARTSLFLKDQTDPSLLPEAEGNKQFLLDPTAELLPIHELIVNAVADHKINPNFRVERSVDLQKALKLLSDYVENHHDIPQALVMLGQVRYLLGDFAGAAKAYQEAIKLEPRDPVTYRYAALVYEAVYQFQDATLLLLQALKYAPKNADIWEQLAYLYLKTGNELDALPSFKEALRIDPERYELYLTLGYLQVNLEMPEDAIQNLQKFLTQQPENKEALRLMLMSLYNPLFNVEIEELAEYEKRREEIYQRLYLIAPKDAEKIRKGYRPPPPVISPPPEPEPDLPFAKN